MKQDPFLSGKLATTLFHVDEGQAHIVVKDQPDREVFALLEKVCPAGLYKTLADGTLSFSYGGCLECGSCRVLGAGSVLEQWNYPRGGKGVEYRKG